MVQGNFGYSAMRRTMYGQRVLIHIKALMLVSYYFGSKAQKKNTYQTFVALGATREARAKEHLIVGHHNLKLKLTLSEMTLNYWVIVEKYPFPNEMIGGSIPAVKSSLYLMDQKTKKQN